MKENNLCTSATSTDFLSCLQRRPEQLHRGYYALDNVCTHLGRLIHPQPDGTFACPCHGSRYTADGQVITGPAVRLLPYLELHWGNVGQLVLDRSKKVTAAFRLPPTSA